MSYLPYLVVYLIIVFFHIDLKHNLFLKYLVSAKMDKDKILYMMNKVDIILRIYISVNTFRDTQNKYEIAERIQNWKNFPSYRFIMPIFIFPLCFYYLIPAPFNASDSLDMGIKAFWLILSICTIAQTLFFWRNLKYMDSNYREM